MKLCCSSHSYARVLQTGALTQLEWIDRCAEIGVDGVDFGASHFPRTDSDYLAQLKKLCVDRGLTTAAVTLDMPFGGKDIDREASSLEEWIERALSLGAPVLRFACAIPSGSPGVAWRELIRGLKRASIVAKDRNVTLAIQARDATLVGTPAEVKRALKECDSAWLRAAPTLTQVGSPDDEWIGLVDEAVIVLGRGEQGELAALAQLSSRRYIGFVSVESSGQDDDAAFTAALARFSPAVGRFATAVSQ